MKAFPISKIQERPYIQIHRVQSNQNPIELRLSKKHLPISKIQEKSYIQTHRVHSNRNPFELRLSKTISNKKNHTFRHITVHSNRNPFELRLSKSIANKQNWRKQIFIHLRRQRGVSAEKPGGGRRRREGSTEVKKVHEAVAEPEGPNMSFNFSHESRLRSLFRKLGVASRIVSSFKGRVVVECWRVLSFNLGKGRRRRRGIEIDDRRISAWRLVCHWHLCCVEY